MQCIVVSDLNVVMMERRHRIFPVFDELKTITE
jgi:hypothetical protein